MNIDELKLYLTSLISFALTYSNLDKVLKLILLLVTIGYGVDKWINDRKNKFKK
jgi:hypothetical protein|tara:strand:- start:636 stop:797 length:162 start_codon:yes stop_codon:yes gene_type:complete